MSDRLIRLGHSPDPDDAFMFYALAEELIPTDGFRFEHVLRDIETLNDWAREGRLEVTALSVHAYAYLSDRYRLLPHGASMGERYGPIVVAREAPPRPGRAAAPAGGGPGLLTSAFLQLQLAVGRIADPVITPFDRILDVVEAGEVDAGLVIHEGQLTYERRACARSSTWASGGTSSPAASPCRSAPTPCAATWTRATPCPGCRACCARASPTAWSTGRALAHAERFGRGLDRGLADRFVGMYVNDRTLDYGDDGRAAVAELLRRGHEAGLIDRAPVVDFVED